MIFYFILCYYINRFSDFFFCYMLIFKKRRIGWKCFTSENSVIQHAYDSQEFTTLSIFSIFLLFYFSTFLFHFFSILSHTHIREGRDLAAPRRHGSRYYKMAGRASWRIQYHSRTRSEFFFNIYICFFVSIFFFIYIFSYIFIFSPIYCCFNVWCRLSFL